MDFRNTEQKLSETQFRMFQELLRGHCGLHFTEESRFLLEKRLLRRMSELDVGSFSSYHYILRKDEGRDQELANLVDELTTNETYFFREQAQLRALTDEILPQLLERKRREGGSSVSIWSAGCASGEEPYSVVMLAKEAGFEPGRDLRVYASDISRRALQKARHGLYRPASFRETKPALQAKYFSETDGLWRLAEEIKRQVVFTRLNLVDGLRTALLGTLDVILCRNVLIYFDGETKRQVVQMLSERTRPGGYLLLGHSESLINLSSAFELRHLEHDLVYRRPIPGEESADPWLRRGAQQRAAAREPL